MDDRPIEIYLSFIAELEEYGFAFYNFWDLGDIEPECIWVKPERLRDLEGDSIIMGYCFKEDITFDHFRELAERFGITIIYYDAVDTTDKNKGFAHLGIRLSVIMMS